MKISEKMQLHRESRPGEPYFSLEYFPPKTDIGTFNLHERFQRMSKLNPMWIDVTWGAGGSTSEKTLDLCYNAMTFCALDVMMHLTCTNIAKEEVTRALQKCKECGIRNILALRGDPPRGEEKWTATEGGFEHASDLVSYIRSEFGDYFCIAVAGYPEGHTDAASLDEDVANLRKKVDAGADFIITQLFYDVPSYLRWVDKCRAAGIEVPISPGIMPIQSYQGFHRMTKFCQTYVPPQILEELEAVKDDEERVKDYGVEVAVKMCEDLLASGKIEGLHFCTLNLESSVCRIVDRLGLVKEHVASREAPFAPSKLAGRGPAESARPIFWSNRPASYVARTLTWDDFTNGRFSAKESPAYLAEDSFVSYGREAAEQVKEKRLKAWGTPETVKDVKDLFVRFLTGEVPVLPWSSQSAQVSDEIALIKKQLLKLNKLGFMTTNSQPRVNGANSNDPLVGWGPANGFVYQKGYVEGFVEKRVLDAIIDACEKKDDWTYLAVNCEGTVVTSLKKQTAVTLTWGVFQDGEVKQPTIADPNSFRAWAPEAFAQWDEWSSLFEKHSRAWNVINNVTKECYLVSLIDNNFVSGDLITELVQIVASSSPSAWERASAS